jgi:S-adenosylmethionine/arginine decarboxylase-like enzyme
MHTFPERRLIWADVFSCKDFDAQPVIDEIKKRFSLRNMDIQSIPRNLEPFNPHSREETAAAV